MADTNEAAVLFENPPDVTVRLADADECFFLDAWNKSFEGTVARLTDSLNRLVTLGTAMAGGALVLLKEDVCYGWFRVVAAGLFFLALGCAVYGSVPVRVRMSFSPASVRQQLARAAVVKKRWVWASSLLLLAGLLAALAGAAVRTAVGPG
jgi:hypothetical protein